MKDPNFIAQEAGLNFNSVVEAIIKHSCIIDYGIIQNIVADGVVDVSVAVSRTEQDMLCMTCVLANIAGAGFTLNVKPAVGDRVLVVYPRIYDDKMFTVPDSDTEKKKLIVNFNAKGYNLMSGIAILINQYKKASHKNVVTVDNGNISAKLNKVEIATDSDGAITVDNGKAIVNIDKDGNVTVDAQGKYTIKNSSTDLLTVISDLNTILKNLKTEGTQSAQTISSVTVGLLNDWETSELKSLLNTPPVTP